MKVFRFLIIATFCTASFIAVAFTTFLIQPNKITAKNLSSENIASFIVVVGNKTCEFDNLKPNAVKTCWHTYDGGDSYYEVMIKLDNGEQYTGGGGYMTSGIVFQNAKVIFTKNRKVEVFDA